MTPSHAEMAMLHRIDLLCADFRNVADKGHPEGKGMYVDGWSAFHSLAGDMRRIVKAISWDRQMADRYREKEND